MGRQVCLTMPFGMMIPSIVHKVLIALTIIAFVVYAILSRRNAKVKTSL